jgi:site-specific DNA recombinase
MSAGRFAFYDRVSTEDQQDPTSSMQWQMSRAQTLIDPHGGKVVAEFFDIGQSRSLTRPAPVTGSTKK